MPNNAVNRGPEAPQLVVMDLLGAVKLGCGWKVLLDSGTMTTDQIAALGTDIIVNQVTDLAQAWKFRTRPDIALEDEISKMLQHH